MPSGTRVRFRPEALQDLSEIHDYVADNAGAVVAARYLGRIEQACVALASLPERGTLREDLGAGLRIVGFERRVTIVFRVLAGDVQIVRVLAAGRDVDSTVEDDPGA